MFIISSEYNRIYNMLLACAAIKIFIILFILLQFLIYILIYTLLESKSFYNVIDGTWKNHHNVYLNRPYRQ